MSIKWPEEKELTPWVKTSPEDFGPECYEAHDYGWNTAIEACKAAVAEAQQNRCKHGVVIPDCFECYKVAEAKVGELVPLDEDKICDLLNIKTKVKIVNGAIIPNSRALAKLICLKFGIYKNNSADLDKEIVMEELIKILYEANGTGSGADDIFQYIISKFGQPKPHACTCQRHPDSAFTVKIVNGLNICPRCGGVCVPKPRKVPTVENMIELSNKFTSINLSTGHVYIDQDAIEPFIRAIQSLMMPGSA